MAAVVDIVNLALSKLGDARIASLDDPVKAAALASAIYDTVRDTEISSHAWNFAKDRKMIPAEAEAPAFGWGFQYLLPADCLRVLEAGPWPVPVMDDSIAGETRPFVLEGRRLLTNHGPTLNLIYLQRVTDVGYYPPTFIQALACKLAVEMGESLSASGSKREAAWREYEIAVSSARRTNAIGLPSQAIMDDTWMAAHRMGVL